MITAKPLRVKHLGRQVRLETVSGLDPIQNQFQPNPRPNRIQLARKEKYREKEEEIIEPVTCELKSLNIKGKTNRLIRTIVETGHGMEAYEIARIMQAFCKAKSCFPIPDYNNVSRILFKLFSDGEITRVKVSDKPYLYYKRY